MQQIVSKTNKIESANLLRGDAGQASLNKACKAKQSRNCQGKERLSSTSLDGRVSERELLYQRGCSAAYEVSR